MRAIVAVGYTGEIAGSYVIMYSYQQFTLVSTILYIQAQMCVGASLSKPHHMRSTVESVFSLACLIDTSSLYN